MTTTLETTLETAVQPSTQIMVYRKEFLKLAGKPKRQSQKPGRLKGPQGLRA